jgi:uncharacterized membrane protein
MYFDDTAQAPRLVRRLQFPETEALNNMVPAFIVWSVLAVVVIGLAIYRRLVATREDDLIHVSPGQEALVSQQVEVAQKLDKVDRLGKALTIFVAVTGVILAAFWIYQVWQESQKLAG